MSTSLLAVTLFSFLLGPDTDSQPQSSSTEFRVSNDSRELQRWMTSYTRARAAAEKLQLPLILHFDATWCGACRRMDAEVLDRPQVRALLGKSVIGVRIDADRHKHLISEFGISTLPTEVVVMADGTSGGRYVGAVSLQTYLQRLATVGSRNASAIAKSQNESQESEESPAPTRSCLIVRRDGRMVGLGGFSPVALTTRREWKRGSEEFVASHESVDYFFESADERDRFLSNPDRYVPKFHGCDPVELAQDNRATSGAIEYGAFYGGQVFFFASVENRTRFEDSPTSYTGATADARTANDDQFPFLSREPDSSEM